MNRQQRRRLARAGATVARPAPARGPDPDSLVAAAVEHHQHGRLAEAEALYRRALVARPDHAEALGMLGVLAHQVGRADLAVDLLGRAISARPGEPTAYNNLGVVLNHLGRPAEADVAFRGALALAPEYAEAHNNLGASLKALGQPDEAAAAFARAAELAPTYGDAHANLGTVRLGQGRPAEALSSLDRAVALRPNDPETRNKLGVALRDLGRASDALAQFQHALAMQPDHGEAANNLGVALMDLRRVDEAIGAFRRARTLEPADPSVHNNLGSAYKLKERLVEAEESFRQALALAPELGAAHTNVGGILLGQGRADEAIACYRRGAELQPGEPRAHSALVYALHFSPEVDRATLLEASRAWAARFATPLADQARPHPNDPDPERRLRIGYVSADFGRHPVGYSLLPVFEARDRDRVELFCYDTGARADDLHERLRAHADRWRPVKEVDDAALAELIRDDRIDILVDLAGHTPEGRLLVFARRPAPVQVTWLGYFDTTGLDQIDYLLTDAPVCPPGDERWLSERPFRLGPPFACFDLGQDLPPVGPPPALASGGVTFACFNTVAKVSPAVVAAWAAILRAVPGSRLILKTSALGEPPIRDRYLGLFADAGIGPARLLLEGASPRAELLARYDAVDVALDPFPVNGGTTTLEALALGVPVVSLAGHHPAGRLGASLLGSLGLGDLVARSIDDYAATAIRLARDLPRLTTLRAELHDRLAASPIGHGPRFTRGLESAFRQMWREWCHSPN